MFFNREKNIKKLIAILSGTPNVVYFVYGPINSGKTSILTEVFQKLSDKYDHIGGKGGDMMRLFEEKRQGFSEEKGILNFINSEMSRLRWIKLSKLREKEDKDKFVGFLKRFKEDGFLKVDDVVDEFEMAMFWIEENILFYDPLRGEIRPQGRLIHRAILKFL